MNMTSDATKTVARFEPWLRYSKRMWVSRSDQIRWRSNIQFSDRAASTQSLDHEGQWLRKNLRVIALAEVRALAELIDHSASPQSQLERDRSSEVVRELLQGSLTEMETQVMTLHYAEDLPLAAVTPKIKELLTQQKMNEMLVAWLHDLRSGSDIRTETFSDSGGELR